MERGDGLKITEVGWIAKLLYRALKKRIGTVPKSKTLAAYHTPTLLASSWMDAACASARTIPLRVKELAQLKAAALVGCPF
jgi:hypothetical protein